MIRRLADDRSGRSAPLRAWRPRPDQRDPMWAAYYGNLGYPNDGKTAFARERDALDAFATYLAGLRTRGQTISPALAFWPAFKREGMLNLAVLLHRYTEEMRPELDAWRSSPNATVNARDFILGMRLSPV